MIIKSRFTKISGVLVLVVASGLTVSHAWYRWKTAPRFDTSPHPPFPTAELAALDRDVQARFAVVVQRDFGYCRIVQPSHDLYKPVSPREKANVAALKAQKLDLLFYTMGRDGWIYESFLPLIKGPGFMTGPPNKLPLPVEESVTYCRDGLLRNLGVEELNEPGNIVRHDLPALVALQEVGYSVVSSGDQNPPVLKSNSQWCALPYGNWKIVAVPVFATSQKCADCHNHFDPWGSYMDRPIKVGDPLGSVMYVYRPL